MQRDVSLVLVALAMAAVSMGCGGTEEPADPSPSMATGTATLRFSVPNGVRRSPNLADELTGAVYGALYKASEVSITGPQAGALQFASIDIAAVDLRAEGPSTTEWRSEPLPAQTYIFLGFFDVDGNGATTKDPDAGDPVTLPSSEYHFTVEGGRAVPQTVSFDLVFN